MARYGQSDATIIDFAAHCYPTGAPNPNFKFIDHDLGTPVYSDFDRFREHYSEVGVDGAVISQPVYMGFEDRDETAEANDGLLEVVDDLDLYFGLASLPTAVGVETAAAELERCLENGMNGGALKTGADHGYEIHDGRLDPVLEVADGTGAPIFVHPVLNASVGSEVLDDAWHLNAILGRDLAVCASLCKVVHAGVLDRFPNLKLVYHHSGGNIGAFAGRIHNQLEKFPPEIWFDGAPPEPVKPWPEFRAQLESRVYVDTAGYFGYRSTLDSLLSLFPPSQVVFGTDFPFETRTADDFETAIETIEAGTSNGSANRIFSENTLELLVNN